MPTCETCGGHVTERFQAVFGANDGAVYACYDCSTTTGLLNYTRTTETETDTAHNERAAGDQHSRFTTATGSDWRSESEAESGLG